MDPTALDIQDSREDAALFRHIVIFQKRYIAERLSAAYRVQRGNLDQNYSLPVKLAGRRLWWRVADRLLSSGVDPLTHIAIACNAYTHPPWVTSLASTDLIVDVARRHEEEATTSAGLGKMLIGLHRQQVRSRLEMYGRPLAEVLTDDRTDFEALFVWCTAVQNSLAGVEKAFRMRAVEDIICPQKWKDYVAEFRQELAWLSVLEARSELLMGDVEPPSL